MAYLNDLAHRIHDISTSKGFTPPAPDNLDQKLLLVVSEVCEAQEVLRDGTPPENIWVEDDGKPEGFLVECADAVIRLLHIMHAIGGPGTVQRIIENKVEYNDSREHMHGRRF
jgi:hypothetical protein